MFNDIKIEGFQQKFETLESAIQIGEARNTIDGNTYYIVHDTLRDEYFLEDNEPSIRNYERLEWQSN